MKLREYCRREGIMHKKIMVLLGVSNVTVYRLMNNICDPKLSWAIKIEDFTNGEVSLRELAAKPPAKPTKKANKRSS